MRQRDLLLGEAGLEKAEERRSEAVDLVGLH
jgi:hypothetical protein